MAKYNEWLTLSDLESIPGLPEWIKKSISGEYLSSRIKATMTGELTSAELAEIRKNVSRPDSSVKHLMTEIEKSLNGWGYDVRFNLTENGLFSFAFRPKGVSGDWKPGTYASKSIALDRGHGHSIGTKGGARFNNLVATIEGNIRTVQEAELESILTLLRPGSPGQKTMAGYLTAYANSATWNAAKAKALSNEFYPATKLGAEAPIGMSKAKLNKLMTEQEKAIKTTIQQTQRNLMGARTVEMSMFYRGLADSFLGGRQRDAFRKPGQDYESALSNTMGLVRDAVVRILTSTAQRSVIEDMMRTATEYATLRSDAESWGNLLEKSFKLRDMGQFTWTGTKADSYSGTKLVLGRSNATIPGMELAELGSKMGHSASNLLRNSNRQRKTYTRPLRVITQALNDYNKQAQNIEQSRAQAANMIYVSEGTKFDPTRIANAMVHMFKEAEKDLPNADKKLQAQLGKGYKKYWGSFLGQEFRNQDGTFNEAAWKQKWMPEFQKSLNFEQVLMARGALPLLNSYRDNPDQFIQKATIDEKIAAAKADPELQKQIKKFTVGRGKSWKGVQLTDKDYMNWAISSALNLGKQRFQAFLEDGIYRIATEEYRPGRMGSKVMLGTGLHGTADVIDDPILALFAQELGVKPSDLIDEKGQYKIAGIATRKSNERTVGGVTANILTRFGDIAHYTIRHSAMGKDSLITDKAQLVSRTKAMSAKFADMLNQKASALVGKNLGLQSTFSDFFGLDEEGYRLIPQNILTTLESSSIDPAYYDKIISAINATLVGYAEEMYKEYGSDEMSKKFGSLQLKAIEDNGYYTIQSRNNNGAVILPDTIMQPDIAIYGDPRSKGGRPASMSYKYLQNLSRGIRMAGANHSQEELFNNFYGKIYKDGLRVTESDLKIAQNNIQKQITTSLTLTEDELRANPNAYMVITPEILARYYNPENFVEVTSPNGVDSILSSFTPEGETGTRRGYKKSDFEKSILGHIYKTTQSTGQMPVLMQPWAATEYDRFGKAEDPFAAQGNYIALGNMSFKTVKGADGEEYYVETDDVQGMTTLQQSLAALQLIRNLYKYQIEAKNALDPETKARALRNKAEAPLSYFTELSDYVNEKESSLVESATKAQVRHSAGFKAVAAPTSDKYFDLLDGKSRGIMSAKVMRAMLSSVDKNESAEAHHTALVDLAKELKITPAADATDLSIINSIIDKIDVDKAGFDATNAKGITGLLARFPLLHDFNVPAMEFFVSSLSSMNEAGMNESPLMVNEQMMQLLNADVDGDMLYAILSSADAMAGEMSEENRADLRETHQRLLDYSHTIAANMKEYEQKHGKNKDVSQDLISGASYKQFGGDAATRLAASIAGEASRRNFGEVGKFDNLRQTLQNFERASGGTIWGPKGQTNPEDLLNYLLTSEFFTIFTQEGISSKKVFGKIIDKVSKENKDWDSLSDSEKDALVANKFVSIYNKLTDATLKDSTYTESGLAAIGQELAEWGLIELGNGNAASVSRAGVIAANMAAMTGDKSWLDKEFSYDTIAKAVLAYNDSIRGRTFKGTDGKIHKVNGLMDLMAYNRGNLLPNSRVADLKSISSKMKFSDLTEDQQKNVIKLLHYNPLAAASLLGLSPQQTVSVIANQATTGFNPLGYVGGYLSATGHSGGGQEDLVALAVAEHQKTGKGFANIRPSSFGNPLKTGVNLYGTKVGYDGAVKFWERLASYNGDVEAVGAENARDLLDQYESDFVHTTRGQVNNIAQLLGKYGTKSDGKNLTFDELQSALSGNKASFVKDLDAFGISNSNAEAIWDGMHENVRSRDDFLNDVSKEFGRKRSELDLDSAQKLLADMVQNGTDDQAIKANALLSELALMNQGGNSSQILKNEKFISDLYKRYTVGGDNDMLQSLSNMTTTSGQSLEGYDVVGREQNLVAYVKDIFHDGKLKTIAGSSDLILRKANGEGGVRIADFKGVQNVPPAMQAQYLAQLLAYGMGYTQTRDTIRQKFAGSSYQDFITSNEGKLYTRVKGAPISEDMFKLMQSDQGYLDELAINYTDQHGNARVYVGKYDEMINSTQGKALIGALLAAHNGEEIDSEQVAAYAQQMISQFTRKSDGPNEYKAVWNKRIKDKETKALDRYKELSKERMALIKEENKVVKMGMSVGESVSADQNGNEYQQRTYAILERIDAINSEQQAIRSVIKTRKEEFDLMDREAQLTSEQIDLAQKTADIKKEQAEAQETFNQSLKSYGSYSQQLSQIEKKMTKATGIDRILLQSQAEMVQDYAEESLAGMSASVINKMSPQAKARALKEVEKMKKQADIAAAGGGGENKPSFFKQLAGGFMGGMSRSFGFGMLGYRLAANIAGSFKKIIGYAQQLDQAMVNIQIVTGRTREEAFQLMDTYNGLAKQLGSTTAEVASSANVWLRQGYSLSKVNDLIASSMYLSKLGMLDSATAAKDLTGIIKGFKLEVSDATDVVSKLTMIDQNAAVSAGNIATAMQQVSASAQQAGLDIDTTMGYISTIADVSQRDPSSVGASLRTIISRYGTVKAGAFAGMGVDNTTDDLENINDIEKVLRRLGISIRTNTMEFRALDDVLSEVAGRWNDLSSVERNAIATAFAGTRQRESFLILMSNFDKARELTRVAAESQGAAEAKYAAYLNSAEAATKRLQNAWEGLTNSFQTSEVVKDVKNFLAFLVENLDHILTTITSIFVTFRATRAANVLREYGGLTKMIGHNFRGAYNATTPEEIAKYSKTASGRMGLKAKGYTDFYLGKDKADIASYMPTFRNQLDKIIGLLSGNGNSATGGSGTATGTGGKGKVATGGNQGTSNGAVQRVPLVMNPNLQPMKDKAGNPILYKGKYEQYEVGGNIYYPTTGGWHDAKTGRFVSTKDAQQAGLLVNPSGVAQKSVSRQYGVSAVIGSVIGGATTGIGYGTSAKDSDGVAASQQAKLAGGLTAGLTSTGFSAAGAGLGFLAGGPLGMMMGQMAGTLIGNIVGPLLADVFVNLIDNQNIARRERSKQASEMLDAVRGIRGDTAEMKELANSGEWSFDTYQKASATATNMMTKLYGNPEVALRMYNSLTGENTANSGEALRKLESHIQSNFLSASPKERQEFVANWEAAQYAAENEYLFNSKEDERYIRKQSIQESGLSVRGALGRENQYVRQFVKDNSDLVQLVGSTVYFTADTMEERIATARRLKSFLLHSGIDQKYNLVRNLDQYIANMSTAESEKTTSAKEQNEAAMKAAGSNLKFSTMGIQALKDLGREGVGKMILEELNSMGGLYTYTESGDILQKQYAWSGSLNSLPEEIRTRIQEYINSDPTLGKLFMNNQGYTLREMQSGKVQNVSESAKRQYLQAFADALGISVSKLADQIDRFGDFSLEQLTKGYENTKSDIDSLTSIFTNMASATGLTADNVETILSKFPSLGKYLGDTASLARAIYDDVSVLIEIQQQTVLNTILSNEEAFSNWKNNLAVELQDAINGVDALAKANSGETFYEALLSLSPEDKANLESKFGTEIVGMLQDAWKSQYNNMQFAMSIAEGIFGTQTSYLSKLYDIQLKNLESQKTALQQINSQREYENKLIDARNKLENAQKEKRQVYREGVGFVYEADQEAIRQAQKELDELDNQKTISELEVAIAELQSQKSWLDQDSERRSFANMEAMMSNIASNENGGLWGSVNALNQAINDTLPEISAGIDKLVEARFEEKKEAAAEERGRAVHDVSAYRDIMDFFVGVYDSAEGWGENDYERLKNLTSQFTEANGYSSDIVSFVQDLMGEFDNLVDLWENGNISLPELLKQGEAIESKISSIDSYYNGAIQRVIDSEAQLTNMGAKFENGGLIGEEDMLGKDYMLNHIKYSGSFNKAMDIDGVAGVYEDYAVMSNLLKEMKQYEAGYNRVMQSNGNFTKEDEQAYERYTTLLPKYNEKINAIALNLYDAYEGYYSEQQLRGALKTAFKDYDGTNKSAVTDLFYSELKGEAYVGVLDSVKQDLRKFGYANGQFTESHDNTTINGLTVYSEADNFATLMKDIQQVARTRSIK